MQGTTLTLSGKMCLLPSPYSNMNPYSSGMSCKSRNITLHSSSIDVIYLISSLLFSTIDGLRGNSGLPLNQTCWPDRALTGAVNAHGIRATP